MNRRLFVAGISAAIASLPAESSAHDADLSDFVRGTYPGLDGTERTYYRSGSGPPVMVLHEIFGWSPADVAFCRLLRDRGGFTIYAPVLFGVPGRDGGVPYQAQCTLRVCVSREFAVFERNKSSPVCDDLRVLGRAMHAEHGPPGFGVIGLCLTGNFALAMLADEALVAPVVAEPSLPFDWSDKGKKSLHLSDSEIATARARAAKGTKVLGYRFAADTISPPERFERLRQELGDAFEGHEIESRSHRHHSVFAVDYAANAPATTEAFDRLVAFLHERLRRQGGANAGS